MAEEQSSEGKMICEKYMGNCQDIGSAYFVVNGEPYLVKFGDRHLGNKEDHLDRQVICTRLPSVHVSKLENTSIKKVKEMIKSLGIQFGPVFLQGFIDGDTVRYYDPGMRMPGGDYDRVLKKATRFDTVKSLIHFALTGDTTFAIGNPKECYKLNGGIALLLCFCVRPGKISHIIGMEKLLKDPRIVYCRQNLNDGDIVPDSGDVQQRVGAAGVYIPVGENVNAIIAHIYNTYRVLDENGNDMIISKVYC